jgi:membrane protein required for beta-lactamase induction
VAKAFVGSNPTPRTKGRYPTVLLGWRIALNTHRDSFVCKIGRVSNPSNVKYPASADHSRRNAVLVLILLVLLGLLVFWILSTLPPPPQ